MRKRKNKRRWCGKCGHQIPADKIALAYATSKLLKCSGCGRVTTAIAIDEVAGNLREVRVGFGKHKGEDRLVFERMK